MVDLMSLFGGISGLVQLLRNTVESQFASGSLVPAAVGDVVTSWTCPLAGVYRIDWHIYAGSLPGGMVLERNGAAVFAPATLVIPDGGYKLQLICARNDVLQVVAMSAENVYTDLIISQIG
jgi:hypothetical protein